MAQLVVIGEDFLKTLRGAVANELLEEVELGDPVTSQDIEYEMGKLAIWLVKQYFRSKYDFRGEHEVSTSDD